MCVYTCVYVNTKTDQTDDEPRDYMLRNPKNQQAGALLGALDVFRVAFLGL